MAAGRNAWFEDTFLESFESKMSNPKYPNQCILTEGQVRVCERYMEEHEGRDSDYHKYFRYYTYKAGGREYTLEFRGRYAFLHRYKVPYRGHIHKRITWRRADRQEDMEYYGIGAFATAKEV